MIRHIIFLKLKNDAEGKSKADNAVMLKQELESLVSKIKEICRLEVGINYNTSQDAYDLALVSDFNSKEDLEKYMKHPDHVRIGEIVKRVRESRIVVDYEF